MRYGLVFGQTVHTFYKYCSMWWWNHKSSTNTRTQAWRIGSTQYVFGGAGAIHLKIERWRKKTEPNTNTNATIPNQYLISEQMVHVKENMTETENENRTGWKYTTHFIQMYTHTHTARGWGCEKNWWSHRQTNWLVRKFVIAVFACSFFLACAASQWDLNAYKRARILRASDASAQGKVCARKKRFKWMTKTRTYAQPVSLGRHTDRQIKISQLEQKCVVGGVGRKRGGGRGHNTHEHSEQ